MIMSKLDSTCMSKVCVELRIPGSSLVASQDLRQIVSQRQQVTAGWGQTVQVCQSFNGNSAFQKVHWGTDFPSAYQYPTPGAAVTESVIDGTGIFSKKI